MYMYMYIETNYNYTNRGEGYTNRSGLLFAIETNKRNQTKANLQRLRHNGAFTLEVCAKRSALTISFFKLSYSLS